MNSAAGIRARRDECPVLLLAHCRRALVDSLTDVFRGHTTEDSQDQHLLIALLQRDQCLHHGPRPAGSLQGANNLLLGTSVGVRPLNGGGGERYAWAATLSFSNAVSCKIQRDGYDIGPEVRLAIADAMPMAKNTSKRLLSQILGVVSIP